MQMATYVAPEQNGEGEGDDGGSLPTTTAHEGKEPPSAEALADAVGPLEAEAAAHAAVQGILQFDQPTGAEGEIVRHTDDDAPAIAPKDDAWKASLRQHRSGVRDAQERAKVQAEQKTGLKPLDAANATARREQQITIEERTGQAFADPAERDARRHGAQTHDEPQPPAGLDDGMDMGM